MIHIFILYCIYFYTHLQTLAIAIQASKLLEPFQGIFVLSAVGRPELSQPVFQAGKKNKCKPELKLSAQFISSDTELR